MAGNPEPLFSDGDLHPAMEAARRGLVEEVDRYDADQLLAQAEDDVVAYIADKLRSEAPVLRPDKYVDNAGEARVDVSGRFGYSVGDRNRPAYAAGSRVEVVLPFDGDARFLRLKPSTFNYNPPRAHLSDGALRLVYQDVQLDADKLKTRIDKDVRDISQWLEWVHQMTDPYDEELPQLVAARVGKRKEQILATKGLVANLDVPVRLRDDPGTFAMPVRRRRVEVSAPPPVSVPFAPEPAFVEEDFEAALQYIRGFRNTLERSPSVAVKLGEEEIRDLLLAALNGHFEGDAGGELFNGKGKTDILIRRGDRNVFIGECKFWKGAKAFGDAIDQLLGHVVWRDAKYILT